MDTGTRKALLRLKDAYAKLLKEDANKSNSDKIADWEEDCEVWLKSLTPQEALGVIEFILHFRYIPF